MTGELPSVSGPFPKRPSLSAPPQVEGYEIVRVLGEGGMGVVYLARQKHPVRRQVALKVVKPGMDSAQVIARFETERQALALLDHPNIAQVYDAGATKDGRPYFVMEYVGGLPITEHCDQHKLSIEQRLQLFIQVCEGVQHAHQKGIIHRDIKPSNVLVYAEDDKPLPKIIDFGVAKALTAPLTERTLFTEQGQLLGTPEYMSPEQAEMTRPDIDTRSDIYSLGVLLYVLLTGALPFDRKTLQEAGFAEILRVIREQDPPRPSTRLSSLGAEAGQIAESRRTQAGALARRLHKELEWIPLKAMRKERERRYESAAELARDIENYLRGNPLTAGPESVAYRMKKFARRNRVVVAAVAAVLAVLIGGTVVSTVFAIGQARERARAERQVKVTQAVADFLNSDLVASVDPARARGRQVTVREILDAAAKQIEGKFKDEPLIEASVHQTLGETYRAIGDLEKAERHLKRAYQLHQKQLDDKDPATLESMSSLGCLYWAAGRYGEVEPLMLRVYRLKRRTAGERHEETMGAVRNVVGLYDAWGRVQEAQEWRAKLSENEAGQLTVYTIPEENLTIPEQWQGCAKNMQEIHKAINNYLKDKGRLPDWLSDLVPQYLSMETLLCPNDRRHGTQILPDPKLPCSYSWELSLSPTDWDPTGKMLNREWKMQQVRFFGNVVPLVRCHHHANNRALNVSMGGQLYWSRRVWELLFKRDYLFGDERGTPWPDQPLQPAHLPAVAEAVLGTVIDADIVRQIIGRQLGKKPNELTHRDYERVERLDLSRSEITYLEFLRPIAGLRRLYLHDTHVRNLAPLKTLTNLQELRLSRTPVANLEPLATLAKLQRLWIDGTQTSNLEFLRDLTVVELLDLGYTPVTNLEPLRTLTNLRMLWLPATQMDSLEGLESLVNLQSLYLWDTRVSDLEPLAALTNLQTLDLSRTKVHNVEPLKALTSLQYLQLTQTKVNDLEPLRGLTSLQRLYLEGTLVTDVGPLVGLANLQVVCLADTQVSDVSPLKALVSLREVHLGGTKVSDNQVAELQRALPKLKIHR